MKRQFCLPCFLELQKAGKHNIKRVGGRNQKITCWRCKRRRYGTDYEISRKGGVQAVTRDELKAAFDEQWSC